MKPKIQIFTFLLNGLLTVESLVNFSPSRPLETNATFQIQPWNPGLLFTCDGGSDCLLNIDLIQSDRGNINHLFADKKMPLAHRFNKDCTSPFYVLHGGKRLFARLCLTIPPAKPAPLQDLRVVNLDTPNYQLLTWSAPGYIPNNCTQTFIVKQLINGQNQWTRYYRAGEPVVIGPLQPDTMYQYSVSIKAGWLSYKSEASSVELATHSGLLSPMWIVVGDSESLANALSTTNICEQIDPHTPVLNPELTIQNVLDQRAQLLEFSGDPMKQSGCSLAIRIHALTVQKRIVVTSKGPFVVDQLDYKRSYTYSWCLITKSGECVTNELQASKLFAWSGETFEPSWLKLTWQGTSLRVDWEVPKFSLNFLTHFNMTIVALEELPLCPIPVTNNIHKYRMVLDGLESDEHFLIILKAYEEDVVRMDVVACSNDGHYTQID